MSDEIDIYKEKNAPAMGYIDQLDDTVFKSNCKLCQSKLRAEAEKYYIEKRENMTALHKWLIDHGEDISYLAVRNHIINHFKKQERAIKLREYQNDIQKWLNQKSDRRSSLRERIAMLSNEIAIIASETEGESLDDRRKSADVMRKLSDSVTDLEDRISDMDREVEPIVVVIDEFKKIISSRVKNTKNHEVKKVLMGLLDDLSEKLGNMEFVRN